MIGASSGKSSKKIFTIGSSTPKHGEQESDLREVIARLAEENMKLQQEVYKISQHLHGVTQSLSWKITAPIRIWGPLRLTAMLIFRGLLGKSVRLLIGSPGLLSLAKTLIRPLGLEAKAQHLAYRVLTQSQEKTEAPHDQMQQLTSTERKVMRMMEPQK